MDIKFPTNQNPFPKTMAAAVIMCLVALLIGIFLGNALRTLFGTDESVVETTIYTDRMSAVQSMISDADQLDSYMNTAVSLLDMDGLRLLSSKNHDSMLAVYNGNIIDAEDLFDDEVIRSLKEMMNTESALYGITDSDGNTISDDLRLWNIAVDNQVVYYYLFYDDAGFIGIAYDHTETGIPSSARNVLQLLKNNEGDHGIWYIIYDLEE